MTACKEVSSVCPSLKPRQCGFTLLEVMVALSILTLAVASVFSALGGTTKLVTKTEQHQMAAMLARSKLNEFLHQKSDSMSDDGDDLTYLGIKYGYRITSTPVPVGESMVSARSRLLRVQVEVFWGDASALQTYSISTYKRSAVSPV